MNSLATELAQIRIGTSVSFQDLSLFPLFRAVANSHMLDYLLLDDAIAQGLARVTELGNGGSVPELQVENHATQPLLLVDGEELIGAKQNRVLNLTVLAPAKQVTVVPVSCVEAGRWSMDTPDLKPARHVLYSLARADRTAHVSESMRTSATRRSNQSAIWDDIAKKSSRMNAASATGALSDVYEKHAASVEAYVRAFACDPLQAGVIFAISGRTFGLDLFDSPTTFRRMFPKLVRSYALDALDVSVPNKQPCPPELAAKVLDRVATASSFSQPAVGIGKDVRINGPSVCGAALWALDRYVHLCAFASGPRREPNGFRTRMSRPTYRHRG